MGECEAAILARLESIRVSEGETWLDDGERVTALVAAVAIDDLDAITALVEKFGHDVNQADKYGTTAAFC